MTLVYEKCNERCEVAISVSDGSFQQASFVNSVNTVEGKHKNSTRVSGVPKLEDANDAGGKNSHECSLISRRK